MMSTAQIDGAHILPSENAKGPTFGFAFAAEKGESNAYPPCHCLPDSAGYLGLVELFVRRRCQIARRLYGQPDQPDEFHQSLARTEARRVLDAHFGMTNGRAMPGRSHCRRAHRSSCSVADAYPSPHAVTPTVDHCPPAHHAVAIRVSAVIWAAVCVERSGAQAESKCEPGCEAPAPTAAAPAATIPAATSISPPTLKARLRRWFASRGLSACGTL
jgi:hypothetical protein